MRGVLLTVCLAGLPLVASGKLIFPERELELNAKPSDEKVSFVFSFSNGGENTVNIEDVNVSCSCLSAKTDRSSYAAGEKGQLVVVFAIGSFTGVQRKALTLVSRDVGSRENERTGLLAILNIPDVITIEPELLQWSVGDKPEEKVFTLKVAHSNPVNIRKITCSREGFEFRVIEKEKGRQYEIRLKPQVTSTPLLGLLKIDTDCAILKHRRKLAFFSIARKRGS